MTQNELTVMLHRLYKTDEGSRCADRIRSVGLWAFRYWLNQPGGLRPGVAATASLVACELQVIVECHEAKSVPADWRENLGN